MSDISKINPNGTEYNIKDATARAGIASSKTLKSSVITVTDAAAINAEDITVDITPIQDLHGYDKPWAGGAGKNLYNCAINGGSGYSQGITFTNTYDADGNIIGVKSSNDTATGYAQLNLSLTLPAGTYKTSVNGEADPGMAVNIRTNAGWLANPNTPFTLNEETTVIIRYYINEGIRAGNTINCSLYVYNGTDYPFAPYSNECPIEGRTGAELDRVGKNKYIGSPSFDGYRDINTYTVSSETYNGHEVIYKSTAWNGAYKEISVTANQTYTFSAMVKCASTAVVLIYNSASEALAQMVVGTTWTKISATFTPSVDTIECLRVESNSSTTIYLSEYQLEEGSQPTAYEPYQGKQYTADFGETVHGGKWHVTKGGTDKTHANIASYNGETINEPWLSSLDEYVAGATPTTGAQVVYPLTTPTTISTPKQNVPMLKGINTVSADCGDTSLKYQPDNVIGELKGEIEDVIDYAEPKFVNYSSYPHDTDPETAFGVNVRLRRDRGYVSIENVALTFWQNYPIADFYYEIQNPVPTEFIPEYDVEKLFLHINGQSFLNVILTNTGILKLRMYSPVRIVDNYPNVFWLQSADETGCKDAKY